MKAQLSAFETAPDTDSHYLSGPLRVVIAYNEVAAGKRAMRLLGDLGRVLGAAVKFQPLPWSFGVLADADWRRVALSDALAADILLIATNHPGPLPPAVGQWVEGVIESKRGTHVAVVALFGLEEFPDGDAPACREAIRAMAERAGLEFFTPERGYNTDSAVERIHERAETLTPLLAKILHYQEPPPNWDFPA